MLNSSLQSLLLVALVCLAPLLHAETILLEMKPGIQASAEYIKGNPDKPVVIALHGFLQTNSYLTITNIRESITDNDYSLLAPTLSYGINKRSSLMACEELHRHTMEDSLEELKRWMLWLERQGHSRVIFAGHSFGSVTALAYLERNSQKEGLPITEKLIAFGLIDTEFVPDRERREQERVLARQRLLDGDYNHYNYRLSYCNRYRTSADAFLSYADWTSERIITALSHINGRVNVLSVLGSKDKRVPKDWPARQRAAGASVEIIEGANHFFGGDHQFKLLGLLDKILGNVDASH